MADDRQYPNPFEGFNWGPYNIDMTLEQYTKFKELPIRQEAIAEGLKKVVWKNSDCQQMRPDVDSSYLGHNDTLSTKDATTAEDYYTIAVKVAFIRHWFDVTKVLEVVRSFPVRAQPSSVYKYKSVNKSLKAIWTEGNRKDWDLARIDKALINKHLPKPDHLEALRIMGDAVGGFGSMPTVIKRLLEATGLVWLMQPEKRQTIPPFWVGFNEAPAKKSTTKAVANKDNVNANPHPNANAYPNADAHSNADAHPIANAQPKANANLPANADNDDDIVVAKIHESMLKIETVAQKVIEEIQSSLTTGDSSILTKLNDMSANINKVSQQVTKLEDKLNVMMQMLADQKKITNDLGKQLDTISTTANSPSNDKAMSVLLELNKTLTQTLAKDKDDNNNFKDDNDDLGSGTQEMLRAANKTKSDEDSDSVIEVMSETEQDDLEPRRRQRRVRKFILDEAEDDDEPLAKKQKRSLDEVQEEDEEDYLSIFDN
ncbi:hypothetical protein GGS26DRAFT_592381 [Hypomontagnella submonticulosa]|nr:hypothetical protein GGS26DRAFT_592381 [Hypomontagnella submonticulosa]